MREEEEEEAPVAEAEKAKVEGLQVMESTLDRGGRGRGREGGREGERETERETEGGRESCTHTYTYCLYNNSYSLSPWEPGITGHLPVALGIHGIKQLHHTSTCSQ